VKEEQGGRACRVKLGMLMTAATAASDRCFVLVLSRVFMVVETAQFPATITGNGHVNCLHSSLTCIRC